MIDEEIITKIVFIIREHPFKLTADKLVKRFPLLKEGDVKDCIVIAWQRGLIDFDSQWKMFNK